MINIKSSVHFHWRRRRRVDARTSREHVQLHICIMYVHVFNTIFL